VAQTGLLLVHGHGPLKGLLAAFGTSGQDGRCTFTELRSGDFVLYAYPQPPGLGYARSELVHFVEGQPLELALVHEAGGSVDVRVVTRDGQPLERVAVLFTDARGDENQFSRTPLTDAQGRFRAHGLVPGRYHVRAELGGYTGAPRPFEFELGRELEIVLELDPLAPR
jgi:hypothetical protein